MKRKFALLLTLICTTLASLIYPLQATTTSTNVATPDIQINHWQVTTKELIQKDLTAPSIIKEIKVAHFSDLHIKQELDLSQFNQVITLLNQENPDIICFTGDFLDANDLYKRENEPIIEALKSLNPPYGKYAVLGNHDLVKSSNNKSLQLLEAGGFKVLRDEKIELVYEQIPFVVAGIDSMLYKNSTTRILDDLDHQGFNILLAHEPDNVLKFSKYPINLQLSGHTHGGQIKFKGIPLSLPPSGEVYVEGPYVIENTLLNVTIGIGYSRLNLRIQCPSTIDMLYIDTNVLSSKPSEISSY